MKQKPQECLSCTFYRKGTGFVPPEVNPEAKIAVLLESPHERDVNASLPLHDWFGTYFMDTVARPLGLERHDFMFDHAIRCRTPQDKWPLVNSGAQTGCRRWDRDLMEKFRPTILIPSYSVHEMRRLPSTIRLVQAAFQRALTLSSGGTGARPMILSGLGPTKMFLPHLPVTQEWRSKSFMSTWSGSLHQVQEKSNEKSKT